MEDIDFQEFNRLYEENGYVVIRKFVKPFMVNYLSEYFKMMKINNRLRDGDAQVKLSDVIYGDPAFDTFLKVSTDKISKYTGFKLFPTYTYARIYKTGSDLPIHKDRPACEHSCTVCLGGTYDTPWPIWLKNPDKKNVLIKAVLNPGDMVIYKGNKLEHWREKFEGTELYQLFMHYVDSEGEYKSQIYDSRSNLGSVRK